MSTTLQILLPLGTLILGYVLNIIAGSIESQRNEKKRRIAAKEQAYAKISAKLHDLFETYRIYTLNANLKRLPVIFPSIDDRDSPPLVREAQDPMEGMKLIGNKYEELKTLVFEQSLYLKPSILQKLVDLPLIDLRARVQSTGKDPIETIEFEEQHTDQLWSKAKEIMNEMRRELGLEPYPDSILKMWR